MLTIIEMSCNDQDLEITSMPVVASGGIHENFVAFTFCEKWEGLTKTGVFYRDGKKLEPYYSMVDDRNMCEVPHEVTDQAGTIYIGVFGVVGDAIKTSKVVAYKVKQGAITSELAPTNPSQEIWDQLLKSYNDVLKAVEASNQDQREFINTANKAVVDCNNVTEECYNAIAMLNYTASDTDGGDPSIEEISDDGAIVDGGTPY